MIYFPLIVKAGQTIAIATRARSVYYESSPSAGDTTIRVVMQGGAGSEYLLKVGQGFRAAQDYEQLLVTNPGATDITGSLVLADAGFFDNRVVGTVSISGQVSVVGTVDVVDGGIARSLGDVAFMSDNASAPVAAKYSAAQIWNPSTTKIVVVKRVIASSAVGGSLFLSPVTVMATTFVKNAQSKRAGSANVSVAAMRNEQVSAQYANRYLGLNIGANSVLDLKLEEPFALMPSTGLNVWGWINQDISCTFEFYERLL